MKTASSISWFAITISVILIIGCASFEPINREELKIKKTFELPKTKEELWLISMDWMVNEFVSAKDVIQFSEKEQGIIIGKGITQITYTLWPVDTCFTLKIETKDNKARITVYDPYIKTGDFIVQINAKADLQKYQLKIAMIMISYERTIFKETDSW